MSRVAKIRDPRRDARLVHARILWLGLFMVVAISTVLLRLWSLQGLHGDRYEVLADDNRIRVLPVPPPRGLIYSRDGLLLADNRPGFALVADQERIKDFEEMLARLATVIPLSEDEIEQIKRAKRGARRFDDLVIKATMRPDEVAAFEVNSHRFPALRVRAELVRHYPYGPLFAHLVGYVGSINEPELASVEASRYAGTATYGKSGVEATYENWLHGYPGSQRVEVNAQGRFLRTIEREPALPGNDMYLTVDATLQAVTTDAMAGRRGAAVALDVQTGDVLALVSTPSFDPNWFVGGITNKRYRSLQDPRQRPLYNRAIQGQYPPGSTIKPMVGLAGLHYGLRTPSARTWCPGYYQLEGRGHRYRDWLKTGHGSLTLKDAIARSCDVYFYDLAHELGIRRLAGFMRTFGFGARTGVDLPNENAGLMPGPEWKEARRGLPWYPGETLITGIGQGFVLATPLQLAHATQILASRGIARTPRVVGQLENPTLQEATERPLHEWRAVEVDDPALWQEVIDGMAEVVHGARGTARASAKGAAYRYAGKTGTAQLFRIGQDEEIDSEDVPEHLRDHALFIAFAPLEAPEVAVAVVVENGGGGSKAAAPVAREMLDVYFAEDVQVAVVAPTDAFEAAQTARASGASPESVNGE